jgi:hypothetical protein
MRMVVAEMQQRATNRTTSFDFQSKRHRRQTRWDVREEARMEAHTDSDSKYWFPAKRYGWGWSPPSRWQGWLVQAGFVALLVLGAFLFPPGTAVALLIGVCWLTGASARWR